MESYYKMLNECLGEGRDSIDFIWNCCDGEIISAGSSVLFPEGTDDPFAYMAENGYIDRKSEKVYSIFCSKINEGISKGIKENYLEVDVKFRKPDGEFTYYHIYTDFKKNESGVVAFIHASIRPFSEKEKVDRSIVSQFSSDKRPDLFNKRIVEMINRNKEAKYAFIQFDVERFKLINDRYGSEVGDEILEFFNDTLDVICEDKPHSRLTADVFMVVMPYKTREDILEFVHILEERLLGYMGIEYRLIFGVAMVKKINGPIRRYGDNATLARHSIKGNALKNISFYEEKMIDVLNHKHTIEYDMHKAVENNEFAMFLQPKYSISTGKIIGAEALSRWIHPEKGLIPPCDYIPVFEKNGFIIRLDEIMWENACKKIRSWLDSGKTPVPISVNVSREYLCDDKIVNILMNIIEKYNIPINLLELEITESLDIKGVDGIINQFKENGFTMLMDDFGSGYSSLNMLKTTPFDVLKIDRGFLSEFMESERGRKIISHTISMSNDIGIDIIAEGVETSEQAVFLNKCGCDMAQGFYYSRPVPHEEFDKLLFK
ncbi:MAG: putative bifunctional diguanylate cyclase/phosphodiesterase [Porcipelethomonas sp.]